MAEKGMLEFFSTFDPNAYRTTLLNRIDEFTQKELKSSRLAATQKSPLTAADIESADIESADRDEFEIID